MEACQYHLLFLSHLSSEYVLCFILFFFFLRLLYVLETRAMVTDQSLDNGINEFIQGRQIQCMHSNLIEN